MRKIVICLLIVVSSLLSGCGTILSIIEQDYSVYAGVRRDLATMEQESGLHIVAVVDLPLSFVLDTLLLPVTLAQE